MLIGCRKVKGSSLVYPILTSISCRYSMSYDISISLLKKNFIKIFLIKALGKGELNFKRRAGGQSNMTTFLYKSDQSHMTISIPLAVPMRVLRTITAPRQYPSSTLSGTFLQFSGNTFVKPKLDIGLCNSQFNRP
jgi:hypothetical protein